MTVKQLISKLRKEDQSAIVLTADHDHSEGEWNGYVRHVGAFDHGTVDDESFRLDESLNYVKIKP